MATATPEPQTDERIVLHGIGWDAYVAINDALVDRQNPRMIYADGSLTILVTSRRHDYYAERLGLLVTMVATELRLEWEPSGQATFRSKTARAGVEGDRTYHFGEHAVQMRGPVEIDLSLQPPPDLAIEVEVTHPADSAVSAWGRLGVPEIWRFAPEDWDLSFWQRRADGVYEPIEQSLNLPGLTISDVLDQLKKADVLGSSAWTRELPDWVRDVLAPRLGGRGQAR